MEGASGDQVQPLQSRFPVCVYTLSLLAVEVKQRPNSCALCVQLYLCVCTTLCEQLGRCLLFSVQLGGWPRVAGGGESSCCPILKSWGKANGVENCHCFPQKLCMRNGC